MKKLTKKEALKLCAKMWFIMADKGYRGKPDAIKDMGYDPDEVVGCCFACEYDATHVGYYCDKNCIMTEVWDGDYCENPNSPYGKWSNAATEKTSKKYALIIAKGAERLAKKL